MARRKTRFVPLGSTATAMSISQKLASRRLPPTFTSLYRLFIRTSSASVLHQKRATRNLRRLWRPTFDGAASAIHQLQDEKIDPTTRNSLQNWLEVWNHRSERPYTFYDIDIN